MNLDYKLNLKPEKEVFQVFKETIESMIIEDPKVIYLDADLMAALKTQDLWRKYPKNVINCGIQEANMVGVASGLYLNGYKPFIHSFAPFVSRRVFDQLYLSVGYAEKSVHVIASEPGIMATHNGGTHMCFEDVAMVRCVPNACIVDVSDSTMLSYFLRLTKDRSGLTYIRMPRRNLPDIYTPDNKFKIGKGKILKDGSDLTLIGCGIMVQTCLEAADLLIKDGIRARVVDIVTVKPLDKDLVLDCAKSTGIILTAENANIIGGLGSAVTEFLCSVSPTPVFRIGVKDHFGCVGDEKFLRNKFCMTALDIYSLAKSKLESKY